MTTFLHQLQELGQSVWYDNIRRALLDSGRLREYVDDYAVTGVTSNPSIFEKAISGSSDYDGQLASAVGRGRSDPEELFWDLAVRDIQDAADLLRDVSARLEPLANAGHPVLSMPLAEPSDFGSEVLRWEIATALAGAILGMNPFDQPDVEAAKDAAREAHDAGVRPAEPRPPDELLATVGPGDYLAIQAFVDPEAEVIDEIERIRTRLRDTYRVATTVGIG